MKSQTGVSLTIVGSKDTKTYKVKGKKKRNKMLILLKCITLFFINSYINKLYMGERERSHPTESQRQATEDKIAKFLFQLLSGMRISAQRDFLGNLNSTF